MIEYLTCPKCGSTDLFKCGKSDKEHSIGIQIIKCKICNYKGLIDKFGKENFIIAPISQKQKEIEYERYAKHRVGTTASDITKQKMSESHVGQPSYWKGKTIPQETRDKMSASHKDQIPWNKGIPSSQEAKDNQSKSLYGKPKSLETRKNMGGQNNNRWRGGITPFLKTLRMLPEMYEWRSEVMERDDYRDRFTGIRGNGNLEVHHIIPFSQLLKDYNIKTIEDAINCKELWDIENGVTMFKDTHMNHHKKYKNSILPREYYSRKDI